MTTIKQIIRAIKHFIDLITNPVVVKIQPITRGNGRGDLVTMYRLSKRPHSFTDWTIIGEYSTFKAAMKEID